jgi:hypothetical protein
LTVDGDAEVLESDRIAPHGPLAHTELGGRRAPVDDRPVLEQLEEREESGGRTGDLPKSSTPEDKN